MLSESKYSVLKFLFLLLAMLGVVAYGSSLAFQRLVSAWFMRDMVGRSKLTTAVTEPGLVERLQRSDMTGVHDLLVRVTEDERLFAIGVCDKTGAIVAHTEFFDRSYRCETAAATGNGELRRTDSNKDLHVAEMPLRSGAERVGTLVFVNDLSLIRRRSAATNRYLYFLFLALAVLVSGLTLIAVRTTRNRWITGFRAAIREKGDISKLPSVPGELFPVIQELKGLIGELESEKKLYEGARVVWDPTTLKELLSSRLSGDEIIVVANREPYIHNKSNGGIEVQVPASGVVTALEPVMRACSGVWVAHGSGSADREVVDERDCVWVPPDEKSYQLRRVWLGEEEENGYYYGFANEGIWPLCHIAHTRPVFRGSDWEHYRAVNDKFAAAVIQEADTDNPVVLVQDYHFALLPRIIRRSLPKATIITFWHIPWPNPEAFGICPWREELLDGLLGSTILGFHTRYHRNNFLDTVDRFIESRIDREHFTVVRRKRLTAVRSYPISIEWPPKHMYSVASPEECKKQVRKRHALSDSCKLAIGVERLDYTKGILERFAAVERLFDLNPEWIGKFTLLQIAAPSRSTIRAYSSFTEHVEAEAKRLNEKYNAANPPIILLKAHHSPEAVYEYLRAADVCLVTSLHDGMNLVAKEFIAARTDEQGVLILSLFAGASRELPEALIVNPYDADQCAKSLLTALTMSVDEMATRMRSMRDHVREYNVYRWAGKMLAEAASVRERMKIDEQLSEASVG